MLGDGNDVGACDFCDCDAAIGGVCGVKIDVVRADAGCDGEFKVLRFGEAFGG